MKIHKSVVRKRSLEAATSFVARANTIHSNYYSYTKAVYITATTNITITCPIHGDFDQQPNNHLHDKGCHKCAVDAAKVKYSHTKELFITNANAIHGSLFDYTKVDYINARTKVTIVCKEHGEFLQLPTNHLRGTGCPMCAKAATTISAAATLEHFIEKATITHGDKYDYSEVQYINNRIKVNIICPTHGVFTQVPASHYKHGCPKCANEVNGWGRSVYLKAPTYLYILQFGSGIYKIGITKESIFKRYKRERRVYSTIAEILFQDGTIAYDLERTLLKATYKYKYSGPEVLTYGGDSELRTINPLVHLNALY